METKEIKIEVPQGYAIDKEKSTFEKIVYENITQILEQYYLVYKVSVPVSEEQIH